MTSAARRSARPARPPVTSTATLAGPPSARKPPAPVFVDTFALCEWILGRLGDDGRVLARSICRTALHLLDQVALALRQADPEALVEDADDRLVSLRVQIRLAASTNVLAEEQGLFALEAADNVGRQLGGWRRALAWGGV